MRFRFCGELDCPDWVLAEIATLSKLTSVKMKLLCVQVIKNLLTEDINYEKVQKLTADAKFETGDIKASIAVLSFVISSAAKYGVDDDSLSNELQQLGLPKEHAGSLCRSYGENLDKLQTEFRKQSFRLSRVESVDWRVDYVLGSSELKEVNEPSVQMRMHVRDADKDQTCATAFNMSADQFRVFLNEMKQAYAKMEDLVS